MSDSVGNTHSWARAILVEVAAAAPDVDVIPDAEALFQLLENAADGKRAAYDGRDLKKQRSIYEPLIRFGLMADTPVMHNNRKCWMPTAKGHEVRKAWSIKDLEPQRDEQTWATW